MRPLLSTSIIFAAGLALSGAAGAQPYGGPRGAVVSSQPVPDTSRESAGIPGPDAVNPAPGARGPYVGAGRHHFYDVDARISNVSGRIQSLPRGEQRQAMAQIHRIRSEEATQRARHGNLRDWDRENLNHKLDNLVQQFPSLAVNDDQGPPPAQ